MDDILNEPIKLLIIDGDYVAFCVASLLETRDVKVSDSDGNEVGVYKNKTTFKKSDEYDETKTFTIEDRQHLEPDWESRAPVVIRSIIESYLKKTDTHKPILAFGGKTNFRDDIPSPIRYKSSRGDVLRPLLLSDLKDKLKSMYECEMPETGEADDVVSYYQYKSLSEPEGNIVVCTVDKDAKGSPCKALFNPVTEETISVDPMGSIELVKTKSKYQVKATGQFMVAYQLLVGDATDSYFPCSIYKQINAIDKKSAMLTDRQVYAILKDCKTVKEIWEAVIKQYKTWYPGEIEWTCWKGEKHKGTYKDPLQHTLDACYMRRWEGDRPVVDEIMKRLKIDE